MGAYTQGMPALSLGAADLQMIGAARHEFAARLMDSLIHEARNPLNALAINIGVLSQKLRAVDGAVPASQEKNLAAMREQISRVDGTLKMFYDLLSRGTSAAENDFSDAVNRAIAVLGHELRRAQVKWECEVEPGMRVGATPDAASTGGLGFLAAQPLLRGLSRTAPGELLKVRLSADERSIRYSVEDRGADGEAEPFSLAIPALERVAAGMGGGVKVSGGLFELSLSRS